ncbi:MAG TPA: 4-hydroxy-tetrahydrodipicolinate reductase [Bacteroidia bacterium]|jgi:4-hydroxy-tetrahydrodipicolinate reductase|nr:4-hydroxy-tetrahydrodipicolinate reductase [Bacteroidia bacterium]
MKIALIGYGKMGRAIERIALAKGYDVPLVFDETNLKDFTVENLKTADVAIEFSTPGSAVTNILKCFDAGVPVVCGTTGWLDRMEEVKKTCNEKNGAFFYASNYSIGVNLFFRLNVYLARLMKTHPEYFASMEEIHHTHKKDAPSGTAIALAEGIMKENDRISKWVLNVDEPKDNELGIESIRIGEVPGTHTVYYTSECDEIKISHEAYSRKGFAEGAVHAAVWLAGRKGVFGMKDLLEI